MPFSSLRLEPDSPTPVYRQIADGVVRFQREGRLADGDKLPPTRDLARTLGVNRNTVVSAYEALQAEGRVESRTGKGTFLIDRRERPDPGGDGFVLEPSGFSRAARGAAAGELAGVYRLVLDPRGISFAGSYPADDLLPVDDIRRALDRALREDGARALGYASTAGDPRLRAWIAESMRARGSKVHADDVIVTHGAQQGIDLVFRAFVDPGDPVIVETPTYTGAIGVLRALGARAVGVPVDDGGVRLDALESALERHRPRIMYLQPTFQNPTGAVLDGRRRSRVLDLAHRYGCRILEDDWGSDLAFGGPAPPSLHATDRRGRTLHLGTFSKRLLPGIRVGWIAAPRDVMDALRLLKQLQDFGNGPLVQAGLVRYLESGALDPHLERVRGAYRARATAMVRALERHFPPGTRWTEPAGGLFLWIRLPEGVGSGELFRRARERGVSFSRGPLFHPDGSGERSLRLAFGAHTPERIEEGIRVLGEEAVALAARNETVPAGARRESVPIL